MVGQPGLQTDLAPLPPPKKTGRGGRGSVRRAMRAKSNDTAHNFSCHPCFGCLLLHLVPFVGKIVSLPEQTDVYLIKPHDRRACPH